MDNTFRRRTALRKEMLHRTWGWTFIAVALFVSLVAIDVFGVDAVAWGYYLIPCAIPVPFWLLLWSYNRHIKNNPYQPAHSDELCE